MRKEPKYIKRQDPGSHLMIKHVMTLWTSYLNTEALK